MKKYVCDKCNKTFNFEDEISICPYCGYKHLRDLGVAMKKLVTAVGSMTGRMQAVILEDGTVEPLFFTGETTTEIIGDIIEEKEITNVEYEKCEKYL